MSAMQEVGLETLRFHKVTHFVRDYEDGKSGEGSYAVAFCGVWANESWVVSQKFSQVEEWCLNCYRSRRKWIERVVDAASPSLPVKTGAT